MHKQNHYIASARHSTEISVDSDLPVGPILPESNIMLVSMTNHKWQNPYTKHRQAHVPEHWKVGCLYRHMGQITSWLSEQNRCLDILSIGVSTILIQTYSYHNWSDPFILKFCPPTGNSGKTTEPCKTSTEIICHYQTSCSKVVKCRQWYSLGTICDSGVPIHTHTHTHIEKHTHTPGHLTRVENGRRPSTG